MKSRTSSFNLTILKKDITRFAPAWVLYSVFLLLYLLVMVDTFGSAYRIANDFADATGPFAVVNLIYALLCGELLFGDLFHSRLANALHALPMRREHWFATHVVSGILFSFVPNLAMALIAATLCGSLFYIPLLWLLAVTIQYLFFFGVAAFSALSVGNRFAMAVVYTLVNFASMLTYWLIDTLYMPLMHGVNNVVTPFYRFSPVIELAGNEFIDIVQGEYVAWVAELDPDAWVYLVIVGAVGIALGALALQLYRKRDLEVAGDFMAVRAMAPIFLVVYTVMVGAVIQTFFSLFVGDDSLLYLFIGIPVGYFTGLMLLKRTPKVFNVKTVLGFIALAAVLGISLLVTWLDLFGITSWKPEGTDQVRSVTVLTTSRTDGEYITEDPEEIRQVMAIHEQILEERRVYQGTVDNGSYLYLDYQMVDGSVVSRSYWVTDDMAATDLMEPFLSKPEYVLGRILQNADELRYYSISVSGDIFDRSSTLELARADGLLEALIADCEAGNMAQEWLFIHDESPMYYMIIEAGPNPGDRTHYLYLNFSEDAVNTLAWLEERLPNTEDN